jgi:hypothetical protein
MPDGDGILSLVSAGRSAAEGLSPRRRAVNYGRRARMSGRAATLGAVVSVAIAALAAPPACATEPAPLSITVFPFELNDRSAGGGVIAQDAVDTENLAKSTEEARRMLVASGRYSLVEAGGASAEVTAKGGVLHCNGCEAKAAAALGAERSMAGILTRVNRTEYTLQIVVRDTASGEMVANAFTGLRMGANYAWPRGVKWLMTNRVLAAPSPQ